MRSGSEHESEGGNQQRRDWSHSDVNNAIYDDNKGAFAAPRWCAALLLQHTAEKNFPLRCKKNFFQHTARQYIERGLSLFPCELALKSWQFIYSQYSIWPFNFPALERKILKKVVGAQDGIRRRPGEESALEQFVNYMPLLWRSNRLACMHICERVCMCDWIARGSLLDAISAHTAALSTAAQQPEDSLHLFNCGAVCCWDNYLALDACSSLGAAHTHMHPAVRWRLRFLITCSLLLRDARWNNSNQLGEDWKS